MEWFYNIKRAAARGHHEVVRFLLNDPHIEFEYMGRGRLIKLSNSNEGVNSEVIINNNVRHSYFHICDEDTKLTQQQLVDNGLQAIGEYLYI